VHDTRLKVPKRTGVPTMLAIACPALNPEELEAASTKLLNFAAGLIRQFSRHPTFSEPEVYVLKAIENCRTGKALRFNSVPVAYIMQTLRNELRMELRSARRTIAMDPTDLVIEADKQSQAKEEIGQEYDCEKLIQAILTEIDAHSRRYQKRFTDYVRLLLQDRDWKFLSLAKESGEWVFHPTEVADALGISVRTAHRLREDLTKLRAVLLRLLRNG